MDDTLNTPSQPTLSAKPRRRWLRFRLRTLLVVVTLAGCGLGWLGSIRNRANRQRIAVEKIRKAACQVYYSYEFDGTRFLKNDPPSPAWLRNLIGIDYFVQASFVGIFTYSGVDKHAYDDAVDGLADLPDLRSARLGDATDLILRRLGGATQLRDLEIDTSSVTDAGWESLERFSHLENLTIVGPTNGDAALSRIKGLTNIKVLFMNGIGVTDAGLRNLAGLSNLEDFTLEDFTPLKSGNISDTGWEPLRHLRQLTKLSLSGHDVTNATLKHISGLTNLVELELGDCKISGPGLMRLKDLRRLESISFASDEMTDGGLQDLECLPGLKWLGVHGRHLTRAGINRLQKLMPKLQISTDILEKADWPL